MRVLAVGDIHIPAEHPDYLDFCWSVYDYWECDKVVMVGDVVDWHAISFHSRELDAPGPVAEHLEAREKIAEWVEYFPTPI